MFEPARLCFCGLSLRTTVSILIFIDLFRGIIGISSVASMIISGADTWLTGLSQLPVFSFIMWRGVLSGVILTGAIFGCVGINQSKHSLVSTYAYSMIFRIFITVAISTLTFMYFQDFVDRMVDNLAQQMIDDAHRRGLPDPQIDREAISKPIGAYLAFSTIANELITDILALYFAYLTQSLAVWMQRGDSNPTERLLYSFALPSASADVSAPMLHGTRMAVRSAAE
jgi:hypothetical protein